MDINKINNIFSIKKVSKEKILDGLYKLTNKVSNQSPKIIDKSNNAHTIHIHEEDEEKQVKEDLYIHSQFDDNGFAIIRNEYYLSNFLKQPKAVDMSYYYIGVDDKAKIYLYDMKKTFAGEHEMEDIIEQWDQSIRTAKACFIQLKECKINDIQIGVITENNDIERRKRELKKIIDPESISTELPLYMQIQRKADLSANIAKAKLLKGFDEGKVTIDGVTYNYDVREFINKKYHMYFDNGQLRSEKSILEADT